MSQHYEVVSTSEPVIDSGRPRALKVARTLTLAAAAAGLAAGGSALAGGKASIKQYVTETLGGSADSELLQGLISAELKHAYALLSTKAYIVIVSAVVLAILALAVSSGKRAVRVLLVLALLGNVLMGGMLVRESKVLPNLTLIGAVLALLLSLAAVPFLFSRSVRRYGSRDAAAR